MLYDAATVLNFAVEGAINQNFSILYEQHCSWRVTDNNRYCLQILTFGGEFRWRFKPDGQVRLRIDWVQRDALVGHFLGLYGFGGKFDQANCKGCYQGEIMSVGLIYGYAMPICKRYNHIVIGLDRIYFNPQVTNWEDESGDAIEIIER